MLCFLCLCIFFSFFLFFFFNDTATTEIYTLSLHDALPNFGEVADDARFVQATQANMAGTGIATFSDRARDAVRGGGPFDSDPGVQGFASGLYTDPNSSTANGTPAEQKARLLHYQDLIKIGLTGNLAAYRFTDSDGKEVKGSEVDYNGQPAGYAAAPGDALAYADAHDNESLYDALTYKLPA